MEITHCGNMRRVGCCFCSVANEVKLMFARPEGGNHTLWKHAEGWLLLLFCC